MRFRYPLAALVFALATFASSSVFALGLDVGSGSDRFEHASLDVTIDGDFARGVLTIEVTPDDNGGVWFFFPLPPDAVVHKAEYSHGDGDDWLIAETTGRLQGQQAFEQTESSSKLLLQDVGKDFYRLRLDPWEEEGSDKKQIFARIHYAQPLERAPDGARLLRIAAGSNNRVLDNTPERGLEATIHFAGEQWSALTWLGSSEGKDIGMTEATLNFSSPLDEDHILQLTPTEPGEGSVISYLPESDALQPHSVVRWSPEITLEPAPRRIVFVLDCSGSMGGQKLTTSKAMIARALDGLSKRDMFSVVAFGDDAIAWKTSLQGVGQVDDAKQWVLDLDILGGTNIDVSLQVAADIAVESSEPNVDIFLVTDGNPTVGVLSTTDILDRLDGKMGDRDYRVYALGIGGDLSQGYINTLTERTGGEATFALADSALEAQFLDLLARAQGGGLQDAALLLDGETRHARQYRSLFPGESVALAVEGELPSQLPLSLRGVDIAGQPHTFSTTLDSSGESHTIAASLAAKVWATQLEHEIDTMGESPDRVAQAVTLAKTYGIITRYSSMLVLASDALYEEQGIERIERDPAGIALAPIEAPAQVDESRIGGNGLYASAPMSDSYSSGCMCSASKKQGPPAGGALLVFGVLVFLRRARRTS